MDSLKEAFQKVRKDIDFLKLEISKLNHNLIETNKKIIEVVENIEKIKNKNSLNSQNNFKKIPTYSPSNSTFPTHSSTSFDKIRSLFILAPSG